MPNRQLEENKARLTLGISGTNSINSSQKKEWRTPHLAEIVTRYTEAKSFNPSEKSVYSGPVGS